MQFDLARCPDCYGPLESKDDQELVCERCGELYPIVDGVPKLVGARSVINESEMATQDYVTDFYENVRYKLPWARAYHEHTLQQMIALAPLCGTVLDNGCGNGVFLEHLSREGSPRARLVGTDISMGMLERAQRRLADCSGEIDLVQADACRLPFADDSFDVVFARGLLHHLPDPGAGASSGRSCARARPESHVHFGATPPAGSRDVSLRRGPQELHGPTDAGHPDTAPGSRSGALRRLHRLSAPRVSGHHQLGEVPSAGRAGSESHEARRRAWRGCQACSG